MISNVNMLCRRMRVDGCGRSFIYVVYLRFNGYTKGCFTYHCRVYAVSRISKNIKFGLKLVLLLPCMLMIYSSIILRYCILGTLQQHSNTLLITKSKMYIGVRQIQVGKRIVLSKNKHLNINIVERLSTIFSYCFINSRLDYRSYLCNIWAVAKWSNICYIRRNTILSK